MLQLHRAGKTPKDSRARHRRRGRHRAGVLLSPELHPWFLPCFHPWFLSPSRLHPRFFPHPRSMLGSFPHPLLTSGGRIPVLGPSLSSVRSESGARSSPRADRQSQSTPERGTRPYLQFIPQRRHLALQFLQLLALLSPFQQV